MARVDMRGAGYAHQLRAVKCQTIILDLRNLYLTHTDMLVLHMKNI